jgi:signal transduction histidine kinase
VRLQPAQDALRAEFAAATFEGDHLGQPHTLYRTRLDGLDAGWTPWTPARSREFTNLPYRAFTLRVQARALDGRVSPEATWAFVLPPPWWLSPWAWAAYAGLGLSAVAGLVKLRTRALQRRADRLESVVNARTAELATKNAELARLHQLELDEKIAARLEAEKALLAVLRYQLNPHFLYNALASVRALVHVDPNRADAMVTRLVEFCRLTLTRSDEAPGTLAEEFSLLGLYLDMEKTRWGAQLEFTIESDPAARGFRLPPFLVLPLIENAVKYGGQTSEGVLRVRLTATVAAENQIVITVKNTGTWVEPEIAQQRGSTGIGVENLRKRLRRHFPEAHELRIGHADGWVTVELKLASRPSPIAAVKSAAAV